MLLTRFSSRLFVLFVSLMQRSARHLFTFDSRCTALDVAMKSNPEEQQLSSSILPTQWS